MKSSLKHLIFVAAIAVAAGAAAVGPYSPPAKEGLSDWPLLGRNADMQHHSPLSQISDKTVATLGLAWSAEIPSQDGLTGNPLVLDGVVYQSGPLGRVYANDARTGKLLWRFDAIINFDGASIASMWSARFNRGVAVQGDKVFVAVGDCRLIAIDRRTGKKAWESVSCNRTDSGEGLYGITGAPRVGNGMVFIGNNCVDSGNGRGFVDAFDAATGERKWRFYTVPADPKKGPQENAALEAAAKTWGTNWYEKSHGCGSVWDAITYDEKLNQLYIGTAGPAPWDPSMRAKDAGDELYTNSIVALDASTGNYKWHFKTTPQDGWNFDATMHIMIAELPLKSERSRVVMTAPKNGFFYVLDAKTGKFVSGKNYTPVNWASHLDPVTGRPVTKKDARYWERANKTAIASPGPLGAHNWQAMAYNKATGLVYIPVTVAPTLVKSDPDAAVGGMVFDMKYGLGNDPKWKTYGELVAWDPMQQKERWRVRRNLAMNGGVMSTAGNLVFQGTADGRFDAFAADTGKLLWTYEVRSTIQAAPTTVEIDGEQVVLVATGNGGSAAVAAYPGEGIAATADSRGPSRLLAFKLGGTATLPRYDITEYAKPPRERPSEKLAKKGSLLFEQNFCVDCHGPSAGAAGGSTADLRRSSAATHDQFAGIVIGGLRKANGMPAYSELSMQDVEAIQAYVLNQAWHVYDAQQKKAPTTQSDVPAKPSKH